MQVPIISGIAASGVDFTSTYPVNMIPVPKATGISEGYLRPADGIVSVATAAGVNRGGYRWRDVHYRVQGGNLVTVAADGAIVIIGTIDGFDWATFTESFDYLAINAGGKLYLYNGLLLSQVTDVDLGVSLDVEWINGYFISTDGAFLVTSDIGNPFSFNILRYASSEINPDPVVGLQKIRNELYALNRYTIEIFAALSNPGLAFPFGRVEGAQIMKGVIGSRACCEFSQNLAFLGGGSNEPSAVWLGAGGQAAKLSTREIDDILGKYTEAVLAGVVLESRVARGHEFLYIHLPDRTLVYDGNASAAMQQPVWFELNSGADMTGYRARGMVWAYNRWNVADPFGTQIGYLSETLGSHYGDLTRWQFTTPIAYNEGRGLLIYEIELVALSGAVAVGQDPLLATEYTLDGAVWSQPRYIKAGRTGQRGKRLIWDRQGSMQNWRVQRFSGDSRAFMSFARLEVRVEALAV